MELRTDIKRRLRGSRDWTAVIEELERELELVEGAEDKSEQLFELGQACEEIVPDRDRALAMFQKAWKLNPANIKALSRARAIYREMGRLEMVAKLGELELKTNPDASRAADLHAMVGEALLDLGQKDKAIEHLAQAAKALPGSVTVVEGLAAARYGEDWLAEVEEISQQAAASDTTTAARLYLRAARILHFEVPEDPAYESTLRRVLSFDPQHEQANSLLEALLANQQRFQDLADLHDKRAYAAADDSDRAELYRRFATAWTYRFKDRDRGAAFTAKALSAAFDNGAVLRGQVAAFQFLRDSMGPKGEWAPLVKLTDAAIKNRGLGEDEKLYAGTLGGAIAWKQLNDVERAAAYFGEVAKIDPENPFVKEFNASVGALPQTPASSGEMKAVDGAGETKPAAAPLSSAPMSTTAPVQAMPSAVTAPMAAPPPAPPPVAPAAPAAAAAAPAPAAPAAAAPAAAAPAPAKPAAAGPTSQDDTLPTLSSINETHSDATKAAMDAATAAESAGGPPDKAIDAWRKAIATAPTQRGPRRELARVLRKAERWNVLVDALREEIDKTASPDDKVALLSEQADIYKNRLKQDSGYLNALNAILALRPGSLPVLDQLAAQYEAMKRWPDLVSTLQKRVAATMDAREKVQLLLRVAALFQEKFSNQTEAIKTYESALELDPENGAAVEYLKAAYEKRRDWEKLIALKKREIERVQDTAQRTQLLVDIAKLASDKLKKPSVSIDLWSAVLAADGDHLEALTELEKLYEREKQWDPLAEVVSTLARLAPDTAKRVAQLQKLGILYSEKINDNDRAIRAWRALLEVEGENRRAQDALKKLYLTQKSWTELEEFYAAQNKLEEYVRVLERQVETEDDATKLTLSVRIGELYRDKLNKPDRAARAFEKVLTLDAQHLGAAEALIPLYEQAKDQKKLAQVLEVQLGHTKDKAQRQDRLRRLADLVEKQLKDKGVAYSWYLKALDEDEYADWARTEAERLAQETGGWTELVAAYETAIGKLSRGNKQGSIEALPLMSVVARVYEEELGEKDKALAMNQRILGLDAQNSAAVNALERLYLGFGRHEELLEIYRRKLEMVLDPEEQKGIRYQLARVYEDAIGDAPKAAQAYRDILEAYGDDAPGLKALDRLYGQAGQHKELADVIVRQLALVASDDDKTVVDLKYRLGQLREQHLGDVPGAIDAYRDILDLDKEHEGARVALEKRLSETDHQLTASAILQPIYQHLGEWKKLVGLYEIELTRETSALGRVELLTKIGEINAEKLGDPEEAFQGFARTFREDPSNDKARAELARLSALIDDGWERVVKLYESAAGNAQLSPALQHELCMKVAEIYDLRLEKPEKAVEFYRRAQQLEPDDATALEALDKLYTRDSRWQELVDVYKKKIELAKDPDTRLELYKKLATLWEEMLGNVDEAVATYKEVLAQEPTNIGALKAQDRLLETQKSWTELADNLARQLQLTDDKPETVGLLVRLASLRESKLSEVAAAIDTYRQALELDPENEVALSALERLIKQPEHEQAIANILEPIYRVQDDWKKQVGVYEIMVRHALDPARKIELLHRIAELYEVGGDDGQSAFGTYDRALREDPGSPDTQQKLERLARELERFPDLVKLYDDVQKPLLDNDLRVALLTKVAQLQELQLQDDEAAVGSYRRVLEVDPRNLPAANAIEQVHSRNADYGRLVEALLLKSEIVEGIDEKKALAFKAAQTFEDVLESPDRAIGVYRHILEWDDADATAMEALERLYIRLERWQDLKDIYAKKAELAKDPQDKKQMLYVLGQVYDRELGDVSKAIETYQGILDIDPEDVTAVQALDRLYQAAGRWFDLLSILDREVELAGGSAEIVALKFRIGQLWERELKELSRSIEAYREALTMDPGHEPTLAALDGLVHREGEPVAAALVLEPVYEQAAEFEKLIDLLEVQAKHAEDPLRRVELLHRIGELYERRLEKHAEAFGAFGRALREDPANERTLAEVERLADATRAWDKLSGLYEAEITRTMDQARQVDLLQRVARVYEEELGQPEKAITTLRRVLDVDTENRAAIYKLDRLYEGQGRFAELAEILRREVGLGATEDEQIGTQFRLGQTYELQLKDLGSAIQVYREILAARPDHGPTLTSLEMIFAEGQFQREIAQILEPLYRVAEQWEKLSAIYEVELEKLTEPTERQQMYQRLAEISEQKLLDEVRAFQWWGRAFGEDPRAELAGEEVERLAKSTGSWAELVGVYGDVLARVQDPQVQRIVLLKVARVHDLELRDAQRAEEAYLRVLQIDEKDTEALAALDKIYEAAGMFPELAEILRRRVGVTMDSEELTSLHFRLGRLYTEALDQPDEAVAAYSTILDGDSRNAKALEALERVYFKREEFQKLYGVYEKMVDIAVGDEQLADVYAHMARIASEALQKDDEAQDLWNRVIDLRGEDPTALVALADIYERREQWRELVDILERTVRIASDREKAPLHKRLGRIWATKLGRERNAIEAWSKALELEPGDLESLRAMCQLYRSTQAWEELSTMLRRLIDVGVTQLEDDELQGLYAQLGELEGDVLMRPNEAVEAWRRVLQLDPGDHKALGALEAIFSREARWEDLIEVLEKKSVVLDDQKARIDVLLQAGATYEEKLSDKQSAAQMYERVRGMDAANITASAQLEAIYREQYNWQKLNEVLLERVENTPDVEQRITTLQNVAKIFEEEIGDQESAFVVLQAAFKEDYSNEATSRELERLATTANKWSDLLADYTQVVQGLTDTKAKADLWVKIGRWYGDNLHHVDYAVASVQQALALDGNHVGALAAMADFHRKRGAWDELTDTLRHHASVEPDPKKRTELYLNLAELLEVQMGDPGQAIGAYNSAVDADPEAPSQDALVALDRLYRRQMQWPDLIRVLERRAGLSQEPDEQVKFKLEIANLYDSYLDDSAHAIAAYRDVVTIDSRNLAALRALESLYEKTGQSEAYLDVLENQLDASGTDAERISLYQRMAIAWEERFNKADRAWECLEKVLVLDERSQGTYRELERLYRQERRWESLVDTYRRHVAATGDPAVRVELYASMGQVYEDELKEYDRAIDEYNNVLSFDGDDHNALAALGRLYEKIEAWDRAIEIESRLVEITDDGRTRVDLNFRIGKILEERQQDAEAAEQRYVTALSLDPAHVPSMQALTEMYKKRGDWMKAANMMVRAEAHAGNPLEKIKLLAEAGDIFHKKLHDEGRAIESFARVIELDPEHVGAGEPLAEMYFAEGRYQELEPILDMLIRKAGKKSNNELHALYFRQARTTDELGKGEKSLKYYKQAYDIDSTHLPTLLGRANLLYKQQDWDNAGKIYQTILVQHRDAQKPHEVVEIYHRLGVVRLKLGERKKALNMFEKALEIDAGHRATLLQIIELQAQQNDWEAVIHAKRAMLAGATEDEKFKFLDEIGDLYQEKLQNAQKSIAAYQEALEARPGDFPTLHKLLEQFGNTKQWKKVVEVAAKLAELERDPVRRGKYLYTAGAVSRDELKALDEAIEFFNQALDNYFEKTDALTPTAMQQYLKAFEAIDKVATQKKDWKTLERNYRRMIKRLPPQGQDQLKTLLLHNLGEIYRTRLREFNAAIAAFEMAQGLDPENKGRSEILAELYLVGGPEHAEKAVAQHMAMIRKEPLAKIDSYKVLFKIYMDNHQFDKAWCMSAALTFLNRADPQEQQMYEQYRTKGLAKAKQRLTDDAWRNIFHPSQDRYVGNILGTVWNAIALIKARPHKDYGLRRKDKLDVAAHQSLFAKIFNYVNQVLNVPQPELYLDPTKPMTMALALTEEKKQLIPSFVVGSELMTGRPDGEIAFAVASKLCYMRPEHFLKLAITTNAEIKVAFLSALKLVVPNFPIKPQDEPTVQQYLGVMRQYVPPQMMEQLHLMVQRFLQTKAEVDLNKWGTAVELTTHRLGFILCGDLATAAKMISTEPATVGGLQPKEKIVELIMYAISDQYFEVRRHLGMAIA